MSKGKINKTKERRREGLDGGRSPRKFKFKALGMEKKLC